MARVLIAEDEQAVRELLARVLSQDGHEVETVADGAAALERLSEQAPFDLLLSDIRMPLMDGVALALAARREHADLTIVLMTGYAGERMRVDRLDGVVEDVVLKPFSIADMKGVLRKALARPRRQATA